MCYYITATVPVSADLQRLREIGRIHSVALQSVANPLLQRQLHEDERQFLTTGGHCDCGTVLGARRREREQKAEPDHATQRKAIALGKAGWSAAKVKRW